MKPEELKEVIVNALDDGKAVDIVVLDVREMTSMTDYMIVASGRTNRQVKALTERVLDACREVSVRPIGTEGEDVAQWVLLDYADAIVHVMQPETRDFYRLEKLWEAQPAVEPKFEVTVEAAK